jgi:hypothetical protein
MAAVEFDWKAYEVPVVGGAAPRAAGADAATLTVHIPDLSAWPTPHDKARILLETAAEVEHALLVQYLYAAFSLRTEDEDPVKAAALGQWFAEVHSIARQEMGHLMTVQNLLLAVGHPPNLEREDYPPRKDLYPFKLHLEPLTQQALAKYVTAEAPQNAIGIEDIVELATQSAGTAVNHVGTIYGLLGVVFSTEAEVSLGGSGSPAWDDQLRHLADAAHQQSPAGSWHLSDDAVDPSWLTSQGSPDNWPGGGVTIHQIPDRASAREAIRDVAEQGEGPTDSGEESHFDRFRILFRGTAVLPGFPAADDWRAARPVPTDPKPEQIAEPRTKRWAALADIRYGLLLGFIGHYLLITDSDDRANLSGWAIGEMFNISSLATKLVTLPQGDGVSAVPFTLPDTVHLPATDTERWALLRDRTTAAIAHVQQMLAADPVDADDSLLTGMVEFDTARLALMHGGAAPPEPTTSFARDILPLFRPVDIDHMNDFGLNLADFAAVRAAATEISNRLKGIGGRMPPPPHAALSADKIAMFDTWVAEGFPP